MAIMVTKGQINDGTMSQNTRHEQYYLCGKFRRFMKKCTILSILGTMLLCYIYRDSSTSAKFSHTVISS